MKGIIIALIGVLLLIPLVSAHAIDKEPISKSAGEYVIEFSTSPKFPVTGRHTHLDLILKDKNENLISDSDVKIEMHKEETTITLDLEEEEKGHYGIEYDFSEAGHYKIHPIIDNKELETEFDLEVDSFGVSGWLSAGIIILLLLTLTGFMIKDCRRNKNG